MDSSQFEQLFFEYQPRLVRFAVKFVDEGAAEDIVQNCFMRLWNRRESTLHTNIQGLLFTMVRNECLNELKHRVVASTDSLDVLTNKITKGGSNGDKLIIDDIKMIYNKRLASLEVDGFALPDFNPDVLDYELYADANEMPVITAIAQSPNATVRVEQASLENNRTAHVIVTHDDGEWVYTLHFNNIEQMVAYR